MCRWLAIPLLVAVTLVMMLNLGCPFDLKTLCVVLRLVLNLVAVAKLFRVIDRKLTWVAEGMSMVWLTRLLNVVRASVLAVALVRLNTAVVRGFFMRPWQVGLLWQAIIMCLGEIDMNLRLSADITGMSRRTRGLTRLVGTATWLVQVVI